MSTTANPTLTQFRMEQPKRLGIRNTILLAMGALDTALPHTELYTVVKTFAHWVGKVERRIFNFDIYNKMLDKMTDEGVIHKYLDDGKYYVVLTRAGQGQSDVIFDTQSDIQNIWVDFTQFALILR